MVQAHPLTHHGAQICRALREQPAVGGDQRDLAAAPQRQQPAADEAVQHVALGIVGQRGLVGGAQDGRQASVAGERRIAGDAVPGGHARALGKEVALGDHLRSHGGRAGRRPAIVLQDCGQPAARLGRGEVVDLPSADQLGDATVAGAGLGKQQPLEGRAEEGAVAAARVHQPAVAGGPVQHAQQLLDHGGAGVEGGGRMQGLDGLGHRVAIK